jgi:hypothetical protein
MHGTVSCAERAEEEEYEEGDEEGGEGAEDEGDVRALLWISLVGARLRYAQSA